MKGGRHLLPWRAEESEEVSEDPPDEEEEASEAVSE